MERPAEVFAAVCAVEILEEDLSTKEGRSWSTGHGSGSDQDD